MRPPASSPPVLVHARPAGFALAAPCRRSPSAVQPCCCCSAAEAVLPRTGSVAPPSLQPAPPSLVLPRRGLAGAVSGAPPCPLALVRVGHLQRPIVRTRTPARPLTRIDPLGL